jgi:hypothetical protein
MAANEVGGQRGFREMPWGERALMVLMVTLMAALPLGAIIVVAGVLCHLLGTGTQLPGWGVLLIAIPTAAILVAGFVGTMGNDLMDLIVGSLIILVLAAILAPVFLRAREVTRRTQEKQQLQQVRSPARSAPHPAPVR